MSVSAPARPEQNMSVLRYFDVLVIVVAAPIMLLIGVPAGGYAVGAGAWIVLRALGVAVDRYVSSSNDLRATTSIKLVYMLGRLFALALAVILVRNGSGKDSGLACLAVIVFAFTMQLATSALTRPRPTPRAPRSDRT